MNTTAHDDSTHMPPPPAKARTPLPHWLLEGLFIVLSVVLGFGAAQYGTYRGVLTSPATYDPASRGAALDLLRFTLRDIASAETALVELYRVQLPKLIAAAEAAR